MRHDLSIVIAVVAFVLLLPVAAGAQSTGEAVRGTIEQGDEPVEGVEIVVATPDGAEVGVATTDADGSFELELPGPGDYTAQLRTDTLPDGVELRFPDREALEFSIRPGQSKPLLFPLGEGSGSGLGGQGSSTLNTALQLFVEGIKFGLIIAMTAVGLSLIFGTTGLVNFAHGEVVTFGALAVWFFNVLVGWHLVPAAIAGIAVGAGFGVAQDRGLWHPLRRRGTGLVAMLVVSIGLSIFLRYLFLYLFEGRTRPYGQYAVQSAWTFGPIVIAPKDVLAIVLSLAVLGAVGWVLQRTKIGKAMRAVAGNRDLAESSGIDVERVIMWVWALAGGLAALGGVLFGLAEQVSWQMGFQLLLLMFAGVILGGLGTAYGALVGSLIVGIFIQMSTMVVSTELKNVGALVVMILVLLVRPRGILGRKQRVG